MQKDLHIVGQYLNYRIPFIIQQSIFSEINITVINGAILEIPSLKLGTKQGLTH